MVVGVAAPGSEVGNFCQDLAVRRSHSAVEYPVEAAQELDADARRSRLGDRVNLPPPLLPRI